MPDWRDDVFALIKRSEIEDQGTIAVVRAVRHRISAAGVEPKGGLVMALLGFAWQIPLETQSVAMRWQGFGSSTRPIDDEELERVLAPWRPAKRHGG